MLRKFLWNRQYDPAPTDTGGAQGAILKAINELSEKHSQQIQAVKTEHEASVKALREDLETEKAKAQKAEGKVTELEQKMGQMKLTGPEFESFFSALKKALQTGADQYKAGNRNIEIDVKAAITSADFTNDATGNNRVIAPTVEQGINRTPKRKPFIRQEAFNGTVTTGDSVTWTEKVGETGQPIPLAELDAYPEVKSSYQQFSTPVKKIGGMTKVSEEKLQDVDWMMNEIQFELLQRHDLVVDSQILSGDGTGNNLKGVLAYATAFAAGSFAAKVSKANRFDVLRVAYNQIVTAQFQPTCICLHPTDISFMELEKDANGQYVMPPFVAANGMTIKGLEVIENTGITEGDFLMCDSTKLGVFSKGGAVLEIGRDGNDFSTDQVSVKLRERLAVRVKGRDTAAFVKGTFATAITAIDKPAV